MATAVWQKAEEEAASHRQAIESMCARIMEVQKDFRTAMERDDALERALQQFGEALEQARLETQQAKQISGETARTVDILTSALGDSQTRLPLRVEEAVARLGVVLEPASMP